MYYSLEETLWILLTNDQSIVVVNASLSYNLVRGNFIKENIILIQAIY